jgi:hypothetical protein
MPRTVHDAMVESDSDSEDTVATQNNNQAAEAVEDDDTTVGDPVVLEDPYAFMDTDDEAGAPHPVLKGVVHPNVGKQYHLKGKCFLLTWPARKPKEGETEDDVTDYPPDFLDQIQAFLRTHEKEIPPLVNWGCCEELTKENRRHFHAYLVYDRKINRPITDYTIGGFAHPGDVQKNKAKGGNAALYAARGLFYVSVPKIGSVRSVLMNSETETLVRGEAVMKWFTGLVQQGKLSAKSAYDLASTWRAFPKSFFDTMAFHKHNEEEEKVDEILEAARDRLKARRQPFRKIDVVEQWRQQYEHENERYNFLVIVGPSKSGKSCFAESLFQNPYNIRGSMDWQNYSYLEHDAVIFHDVPTIFKDILKGGKEWVQAGPNKHPVHTSATMCYARRVSLFKKPVVIVCNKDDYDFHFENDWLKANSVVYKVKMGERLWEDAQEGGP